MRILLVEDDTSVSRSIELMLKAESFSVHVTASGEDGTELGKLYDYDLVILDLDLPDMSGFDVLRSLRRGKVRSPILILSGLSATEEKVKGLGFGADDYLTKPFHRAELVARIHALVRRYKGRADAAIQCDDLIVRFETKQAEVCGTIVPLSEKEYQCLDLLAMHPGRTVLKDSFLNHLYGGIEEPDVKIIDVYICKLRKKLAAASGGKDYIETVWGRGYLLREPPQEQFQAIRKERLVAAVAERI